MDLSELQIRPQAEEGACRAALRAGATREELMEAIGVAAEMRAGAAYAHSALALGRDGRVRQAPHSRTGFPGTRGNVTVAACIQCATNRDTERPT